ncbi:MAG TPA: 30S ribosomal protein S8 [Candidatus Krumholzibacteria bacterium]|nr:30S ribosomal protein S8 [Candidatus Krumholzibacteria bacterium]HPD72067.1 30S ribosomal protein S8 [Candidatus Krumholzibacteria bacterium]HRY41000.1 30S ribosomal protein S8 [Candidatus Krumholzibacteria bacterium]
MSMTDPIADMLTRIRNGLQAGHRKVDMPTSTTKRAIAEVLKEQGYIQKIEEIADGSQGTLRVYLKYYDRDGQRTGVIEGIRRVSRPGRRVFAGKDRIPKVCGGYGISILSTNQGILTGHQCRSRGIGGEVLCEVW